MMFIGKYTAIFHLRNVFGHVSWGVISRRWSWLPKKWSADLPRDNPNTRKHFLRWFNVTIVWEESL